MSEHAPVLPHSPPIGFTRLFIGLGLIVLAAVLVMCGYLAMHNPASGAAATNTLEPYGWTMLIGGTVAISLFLGGIELIVQAVWGP